MIFDQNKVAALTLIWQQNRDPEVLHRIIEESKALVEVIISGYEPCFRDDLLQEAYTRLTYALPHFKTRYSAHNYFTTVIHNTCRTYLKKEGRHDYDELDLYADEDDRDCEGTTDTVEILKDLQRRNKERFPHLPRIDKATLVLYNGLSYKCGKQDIIKSMICHLPSKEIANVVYQSSLIYLRGKYQAYAYTPEPDADELSLLPDLREVLGVLEYKHLLLVLSGINIKLP